ncbi:MAG: hypothetical protein EBX71_11700 [Betaproteobacteria bacterium]|nr:hypothetical protein [Betaproteobacteria bacterium]
MTTENNEAALPRNLFGLLTDVDGTLTVIDMKHLVSEMVEKWLYFDDVESALRDLEPLLKIVEAQLSKVKKSRKREKM